MKRRVFPRYELHRSLRFEKDGVRRNAELVDVSMRGAGLRSAEDLQVGDAIVLELGPGLDVPARVLYRKGTSFGLQFDELPPQVHSALRRWIFAETGGHDVVTSVERVDAGRASFAAFEGVLVELRAVVERVFDTGAQGPGLVEQQVRGLISDADLQASLFVFRNRQHEAVGFCALTFGAAPYGLSSKSANRRVVVRFFGAVLPEYRGANLTLGPLLREVVRFRGRHPTSQPVLFLQVNDPSLYRLLALHQAQAIDDVAAADPELAELAQLLAPDARVGAGGARVGARPFRVRARSDDEWEGDALVDRFLLLNPGYRQGDALCMLLPLDTEHLGRIGLRFASRQVTKRAALSSAAAVRLERTQIVRTDEFGAWAAPSKPSLLGRITRRVLG